MSPQNVIDGGDASSTYDVPDLEAGDARSAGRMGVQLVDALGVTWDLINGPVRLTRAGLKGLGLPEVVYFTSESAGLDGERVTGWRLTARDVFVPVRFKDEAMDDTTGLQRRFWDGLRIGKPIRIVVTDRDGAMRSLAMRVMDDGQLAYKMSPDLAHVESIGLGFRAADPWWYGPAIDTSFTIGSDGGVDFFNGAALAPSFNIVASTGQAATTVRNLGEEPMWLAWSIGGPSSRFRVGVGGKFISGPIPTSVNVPLVIDTDPRAQTAYLGAAKVPFRSFTELDFAPIPPGGEVPVSIELVGQGIVTVTGRPKYRRGI